MYRAQSTHRDQLHPLGGRHVSHDRDIYIQRYTNKTSSIEHKCGISEAATKYTVKKKKNNKNTVIIYKQQPKYLQRASLQILPLFKELIRKKAIKLGINSCKCICVREEQSCEVQQTHEASVRPMDARSESFQNWPQKRFWRRGR